MNDVFEIEKSSGNVFADLDIPEPEQVLAKAKIVTRICAIIDERGLTQAETAKLLNINQSEISALMSGILDEFSSDRLFHFLNALNQDVEIVIKPNPRPTPAKIHIY